MAAVLLIELCVVNRRIEIIFNLVVLVVVFVVDVGYCISKSTGMLGKR
jgi:hypothetical protein